MTHKCVLVFPANIDAAKSFISHADMCGLRVIYATSVKEDILKEDHSGQTALFLPYISNENFPRAFAALVRDYGIDLVFTSHMGVYIYLKKLLDSPADYGIGENSMLPHLCNPSPFEIEKSDITQHHQWALDVSTDELAESIIGEHPIAPRLNLHTYAGLHRQFIQTPGQCDVDKLQTLCAIARLAPKGDVVEIGSLYGRSALALARLAHLYEIGSTISIDPWLFAEAINQGADAKIIESDEQTLDLEMIFNFFVALASQQPAMSYIREPSINAIKTYRSAAAASL